MKTALNKNSQTIIQLHADINEILELESNICKYNSDMEERQILTELRQTYSKLESKAESILTQCESGKVPSQVQTAHLEKICKSLSKAPVCYGHFVRELFTCELSRPVLSKQMVEIHFQLKMAHPVTDTYKSALLFSMPMTIPGTVFNRQYNITDQKPQVEKSSIKSDTRNDKQILRDALKSILESLKRRSIQNVHHKLNLADIPEIIAEKMVILLVFDEKIVKFTVENIMFVMTPMQINNKSNVYAL